MNLIHVSFKFRIPLTLFSYLPAVPIQKENRLPNNLQTLLKSATSPNDLNLTFFRSVLLEPTIRRLAHYFFA